MSNVVRMPEDGGRIGVSFSDNPPGASRDESYDLFRILLLLPVTPTHQSIHRTYEETFPGRLFNVERRKNAGRRGPLLLFHNQDCISAPPTLPIHTTDMAWLHHQRCLSAPPLLYLCTTNANLRPLHFTPPSPIHTTSRFAPPQTSSVELKQHLSPQPLPLFCADDDHRPYNIPLLAQL